MSIQGRIKKEGDWDKISALIANLDMEMKKARHQSLMRWGLKAEGLAKQHMSLQDLNWTPLKAKTISDKVRKGHSENILIATSDYFQSINSWVKDDVVYAGVTKQARNREGVVIADIAKTHEYGSTAANIPARPLWKPVFEETMKWYINSNHTPVKILMKSLQKYGV